MRFLSSIFDAVLNRSVEELIGALLIAAAVAICMAGVYALGRRKSSPSPTFVGSLALATGALCMIVTAGYIEHVESERALGPVASRVPPANRQPDGSGQIALPHPWSVSGWSSGFHVVVAADEDRDGRLTPEEVARLVKKADTDGDGSINSRDIDRLIARRLRTPLAQFGSAGAASNDRKDARGPAGKDRADAPGDIDKPSKNLEK